jgi:hypothetical protein
LAPTGEPYIDREAAAALFGGASTDIFQGDIFRDVEIMVPRRAGTTPDVERVPVMVVSHDCEWTKVAARGPAYPLHVAPLRELRAFEESGQDNLVREGRIRYLLYLPAAGAVHGEYALDLRLLQPIAAGELFNGAAEYVTSLGPEMKKALQGALIVFFTDRRPRTE